jgi:hypothetical protein
VSRQRHQDKDIEALCRDLEARSWSIDTDRRKYWMAKCPCSGKHKTMIHMTPDKNYVNHKRQWLKHHTCWEEAE